MNPTAVAPMASPSGFSFAMPPALRAPSFTSPVLGVEPPTFSLIESTLSLTASFVLDLTSAL